MPILKQLKIYDRQEIEGAIIGVGCLKAKDYDKDKYGHLLLFSVNLGKVKFIKKLFITI